MPKFNTAQLVAFIKTHALTHYNAGWDIVVEAMDDDEIAKTLGNASSQKAALAAFADVVDVHTEQRDMHRNEALLRGAEPTKDEIKSGKVAGLLDDAQKPVPVQPKPAPKVRVLDDRIITQPATDAKHVKAVTQGSKRHLLIQALEKGATIDDLMLATGWGKDTVTSALRWDVAQAGLGCLRKDGKYYLMLPAGFSKPAIVEKGQARVDALGNAK